MNDLLGNQYSVNQNIRFKAPMLVSDLCDYSDAHIVRRTITVDSTNANTQIDKMVDFKKNVFFRSCTSKINNSFTENAESLDIAISIYNLLKYNNYFVTSWSLRNYYRDEVNDDTNENIVIIIA